ncbi:MAG: hypothetical protein ABSA47_07150 [Verrucomicrobiota bacterium]|jgi:hypothetical protein
MKSIAILACFSTIPALMTASSAFAQLSPGYTLSTGTQVFSSGYTLSSPGDTGTYSYFDYSGHELTDGVFGSAWVPPYEWYDYVGWAYTPVENIDFTFAPGQTINTVDVSSVQDAPWDVTLPSVAIYESTD